MHTSILIVEDDAISRITLVHLLRHSGYAVFEAASGEDAIVLLNSAQFEVVVTDISLGVVDGMEVLRAARQRSYRPEVIMLTGHASLDTAVEALRIDAFDYLVKPVTSDTLLGSVQRAVARHRKNAQLQAAARTLYFTFASEVRAAFGYDMLAAGAAAHPDHDAFVLTIGALTIGASRRSVTFRGNRVQVTPTEYAVLRYLAEHPERLCLSRDIVAVSHRVQVRHDGEAQALVKPHIHNLRKKLAPEYLITERGCGFRLVNPGIDMPDAYSSSIHWPDGPFVI